MVDSPPPERATTAGCDNDRESSRYGIRVDVEGQHCGIYKGRYRCGPTGTCSFFLLEILVSLVADDLEIAVAEGRR